MTITTGPREGQSIECDRELVIGREGADLTVEDSEMSRRHATIRPVAGGLEIEDLGSLNGTFVDGQRIAGVTTLTSNASLKMGITLFAVEIPVVEEPVVDEPAVDDPQRTVLRKAAGDQPPVDPNRTVIRSRPVEGVDKTVVRNVVPQTPSAAGGDAGERSSGAPSGPTPGGRPGPPSGGPAGPQAGTPPGPPGGGFPGPPGGGPPGTLPLPVRLLMKSPLGRRLLPLLIKLPPRARRPVVMLIPLLLIVIVVVIVVVVVQLVS
ncbi:MAG: FHA domain-containing protein [Solirubrobacteraceae bacterium]